MDKIIEGYGDLAKRLSAESDFRLACAGDALGIVVAMLRHQVGCTQDARQVIDDMRTAAEENRKKAQVETDALLARIANRQAR